MNYRFRGTTLPFEEMLIALENNIIDKVTTLSASKVKKIDTSAPMEIGMAASTDGEEAFEEGHGKTSDLAQEKGGKGDTKVFWNWRTSTVVFAGERERAMARSHQQKKLGKHCHNGHRSCRAFPRVKLDRTRATKKCVAEPGERIKDLDAKAMHRCKNQECTRCEALDLNEKGRASWQHRGAG